MKKIGKFLATNISRNTEVILFNFDMWSSIYARQKICKHWCSGFGDMEGWIWQLDSIGKPHTCVPCVFCFLECWHMTMCFDITVSSSSSKSTRKSWQSTIGTYKLNYCNNLLPLIIYDMKNKSNKQWLITKNFKIASYSSDLVMKLFNSCRKLKLILWCWKLAFF